MKKTLEKFKALSDEIRLRVFNLFIKSGRNLCVCELMDALQLPQYAISKALGVLKSAGFFVTEKEGTWIYYKLNKDSGEIKPIINFLKSYLQTDTFLEDEERLQMRLALRENNKCVIGIIPEKELLRLIKEKAEG